MIRSIAHSLAFRFLTRRVALPVAVAASLLVLGGCTSGPHQQPVQTSATGSDGKDSKGSPHMQTSTSGPHQGS